MKKRIYYYIKENKVVSINDIIENVNLHPHFVLEAVEELRSKSFVRMYPAVPLSISNNESCYYSTTSKSIRQLQDFIKHGI